MIARRKSQPGSGGGGHLRIGVLASVGRHLDSFHSEIIEIWRNQGHEVFAAAGDAATLLETDMIAGLTQAPRLSNILTPVSLASWARRRQLDVIVTNTATASALVRLAPTRVPVVYFCHGLHWANKAEPALIVSARWIYTNGDIVK